MEAACADNGFEEQKVSAVSLLSTFLLMCAVRRRSRSSSGPGSRSTALNAGFLSWSHIAAPKTRSRVFYPFQNSSLRCALQLIQLCLALKSHSTLSLSAAAQVPVERSRMWRPLPRGEKPSRLWVQTSSRLPQCPGKHWCGSSSCLQGEFCA